MDPRFLPHNSHLADPQSFRERDPQLRHLATCPLRHRSPLLDRLPEATPGIYSLGGGRQIGKSTLLKQWIAELIDRGTPAGAITFLTGELIDDHHGLLLQMTTHLEEASPHGRNFLIVDEVTDIRDWDKAVKFAADAGMLERTVLMVTGSDLTLMQDARVRFPGRRGVAAEPDFRLHPLSFGEYVALTGTVAEPEALGSAETLPDSSALDDLYAAFDRYLLHGGYLTAINDLAGLDTIRPSTLATYSDWIRGDVTKRGRQEAYLREVLSALVNRYTSQITWNALARELSIDHPSTVADYVELLQRMDAVCILPALREDTLSPAPKKARKVVFSDPFILHAVCAWLEPASASFERQRQRAADPVWGSRIVEACVAAHCRRTHPTYYIKAQGEVDVAYIRDGRFWPVEVKWTNQLRPKDIKQVARYPNAEIWGKGRQVSELNGVRVLPLPLRLLSL
ncbi:MAG: ATP-binding protein [Gammaproteobacteria bacterium]|nr:ATP-binding protein [Gammaproteobacteria bacterium]